MDKIKHWTEVYAINFEKKNITKLINFNYLSKIKLFFKYCISFKWF